MIQLTVYRKCLKAIACAPMIVALILLFGGSANSQDSFFERLQMGVDNGTLKGLHSVVSLVDGQLFASAYFEGEDQRWGTPLGVKAHGPDTRHDLRSVTKSIVGLLYAIARDEGIVPSPRASLVEQFPEYPDLAADAERKKITIEHALTMTMGTQWDESLPYSDPNNSEIAMEVAADRYRFVLEQPLTDKPGEKWNYSGGATAIVAKIISKAARMPIDDYADKALFGPLGISKYTWVRGADGEPSAASGLRMRAPDLAKIGQLIVDSGRFEGKQIVSQAALSDMLRPQPTLAQNFHYGHFWYLLGPKDSPVLAAGFGNGGQRLSVNKDKKFVTVIFAGNYNDPNARQVPARVLQDYLVPELQKAGKL